MNHASLKESNKSPLTPFKGKSQPGGLLKENAPRFTRNPRPQENSPHPGNLTEPYAFFFHLTYVLSNAACISVPWKWMEVEGIYENEMTQKARRGLSALSKML